MANTIAGKVVHVKRHGHTVYGNPIISVSLDTDGYGQWHRISDNASLAYAIENAEYRDVAHTFALTRAGRISHVIR